LNVLLAGWALAVLWVAGATLLDLVRLRSPGSPTRGFAEFAAGVALLGIYGMTSVAVGSPVGVGTFYALLVPIGLLWAATRRRPPRVPRIGPTPGRGPAALLAGAVLLLAVAATAALRERLVWDAWAFWVFKARALVLHGGLPPVLLDPTGPYYWTHPEYPLAHPLLHWWLFSHFGAVEPVLPSVLGAFWMVFLPLLLWRSLRPLVGDLWAAGAAFSATAFWPITLHAIGGYAEIILVLCVLAVTIEVTRGLGPGGSGSAGRVAIFLTLAALSKNEGLALAALGAPLVAFAILRGGERRVRRFLWPILPFAALLPWFVFTRSLGLTPDQLGPGVGPGEMISRVPVVLGRFLAQATERAWIGVTIVVLAGLMARALRRGGDATHVWLFFTGYLAIAGGVYLTTPQDVEILLNTLYRILQVLVPAAIFLAIREVALLDPAPVRRAPATTNPPARQTRSVGDEASRV